MAAGAQRIVFEIDASSISLQQAAAKAAESLKVLGETVARQSKLAVSSGDLTVKSNREVAASYEKTAVTVRKAGAATAASFREELAASRESMAGAKTAAVEQTAAAGTTERALAGEATAAQASADKQVAASRRAAVAADSAAGAQVAAGRKTEASSARNAAAFGAASSGITRSGKNIVLGLAAIGVGSIDMASKWQASTLRLNTQAGATLAQVGKLRKGILDMAGQVGYAPNKLSEAMYHVVSSLNATLPPAQRVTAELRVLRIAAEGAQIGGANLEATTYTLVSAMNALHAPASQASQVMGTLNAIVGSGDMTMTDLNEALKSGLIPTARTFGISFQSVGAALAVMGDMGMRGALAGTRLRMSLALLGAPSEKAAKYLTTIGMSSKEATARTKEMQDMLAKAGLRMTTISADLHKPNGLSVALQDLNSHLISAGLSADAAGALISHAFGGGKSGAAIELMAQDRGRVDAKFKQIRQTSNDFGKDWQRTSATFHVQLAKMVSGVEALAIKLGTFLLPYATKALHALTDVAHWLGQNKIVLDALGVAVVAFSTVAIGSYFFSKMKGAIGLIREFGSSIARSISWVTALGAKTAATAFGGAAGGRGLKGGASSVLGQAAGGGGMGIGGARSGMGLPGSMVNPIVVAIEAGQMAGLGGQAAVVGERGALAGAAARSAPAAAAGMTAAEVAAVEGAGATGRLSGLKSKLATGLGGVMKGAGIAGMGLMAAQLAGSVIGGRAGKDVSKVGSGAAIGAGVGTMVMPGIGTAVGGALGAGVGALQIPSVMKAVKAALADVGRFITQSLGLSSKDLQSFVKGFERVGSAIGGVVKGVILPVLKMMAGDFKAVLGGVVSIVGGFLKIVGGLFSGNWSRVWAGAKQILSGFVNAVGGLVSLITAPFRALLGWLGGLFLAGVRGAWKLISGAFSGAVHLIGSIASGVVSVIEVPFKLAWDGVKAVFGAAKTMAGSAIHGVLSVITGAWNVITHTIPDAISSAFMTALHFVESLPGKFASVVSSIAGGIAGGFGNLGSSLLGIIKTAFNEGIIGPLNWVIDRINSIPHVNVGPVHVGIPHIGHIGKLAQGGYMHGMVPGDHRKDGTLAWLSGKEFVVTGDGQKRMEDHAPGLLAHVARTQAKHFAAGGFVSGAGSSTGGSSASSVTLPNPAGQLAPDLKKLPDQFAAAGTAGMKKLAVALTDQHPRQSSQTLIGQLQKDWDTHTKHLLDKTVAGNSKLATLMAPGSGMAPVVQGALKTAASVDANFDQMRKTTSQTTQSMATHVQTTIEAMHKSTSGSVVSMRAGVDTDFQTMSTRALVSIGQLKTGVSAGAANVQATLTSASRQSQQVVAQSFAGLESSVGTAMVGAVNATGQGAKLITDELNKALKSFGAKKIPSVTAVSAGPVAAAVAASTPRHATGGFIGQPGEKGRDQVPIVVGRGEAVLNHGQQRVVNHALAAQGIGGLSEVFSNVRTPHYMAQGGYAGGGWVRTGATIDPTQGQAPSYSAHGGMSFAELLEAGSNAGLRPDLTALLGEPRGSYGMPMETAIDIRMPGSKKSFQIWKNDVGSGQAGNSHYTIDLHQSIASALGWGGNSDVEVALAGTDPNASVTGGGAGAGAAAVAQIPAPKVKGAGTIPDIVRAAMGKMAAAANTYAQAHMPTPSAGGGGVSSLGGGHPEPVTGPGQVQQMIREANAIASHNYNYEWGGGHGTVGVPSAGDGTHGSGPGIGFDCSGAVAAVLHAAGMVNSPMVSGDFMSWGDQGRGKDVSIFSSPSHVFMELMGHYFGTSGGNPGGGANWIPSFPGDIGATTHPHGYARGGIAAAPWLEKIDLKRTIPFSDGDELLPGFATGGIASASRRGLHARAPKAPKARRNPHIKNPKHTKPTKKLHLPKLKALKGFDPALLNEITGLDTDTQRLQAWQGYIDSLHTRIPTEALVTLADGSQVVNHAGMTDPSSGQFVKGISQRLQEIGPPGTLDKNTELGIQDKMLGDYVKEQKLAARAEREFVKWNKRMTEDLVDWTDKLQDTTGSIGWLDHERSTMPNRQRDRNYQITKHFDWERHKTQVAGLKASFNGSSILAGLTGRLHSEEVGQLAGLPQAPPPVYYTGVHGGKHPTAGYASAKRAWAQERVVAERQIREEYAARRTAIAQAARKANFLRRLTQKDALFGLTEEEKAEKHAVSDKFGEERTDISDRLRNLGQRKTYDARYVKSDAAALAAAPGFGQSLQGYLDPMGQLSINIASERTIDIPNLLGEITALTGTKPVASTASSAADNSGLTALLKQQLQQLSQALALSQAQFGVMSGFAAQFTAGTLPRYAQGGPVLNTGLALVHKGEWVSPDPRGGYGSQLVADRGALPASHHVEVNVHGEHGELVRQIDARIDGRAVPVVSAQLGARSRALFNAPGRVSR